jgi:hypothetical protein
VRWATPQLHDIDALTKMVDPALKGIYPAKSLSRFADIIALCVQVTNIFPAEFVMQLPPISGCRKMKIVIFVAGLVLISLL